MSTVKTNNVQIGQSVTATNNFTWYQPASPDGTVRLGNGNSGSVTDRVTVTSGGNVGIGLTGPSYPLSVQTPASNPNTIVLINDATSNTSQLGFVQAGSTTLAYSAIVGDGRTTGFLSFSTNATERMRLDSSGNLGLGVTPSYKLDVNGYLRVGGTSPNASGINVFNSQQYVYTTANWNYSNLNLIKPSTNTASPRFLSFMLDGDSDASTTIGGYPAIWGIYSGTPTTGSTSSGLSAKMGLASYAGFNYYINGTQAMTLDASGNLLVGTTSFTNSNNRGLAVWFSSATNSGGEGSIEFRNTSTSTNSDPNPVLGIYKGSATTTSAQRFVQFYCSAGAQAMGGIVGNGATNVQFVSLSDAREKTNISPIAGSLAKLLALKPSSFDWVATGEHINAGFVAQDVLEVFPEFVVENISDEGQEQRYGLTGGMTGGIIPHLVKAIQELSAELNELKQKVNA